MRCVFGIVKFHKINKFKNCSDTVEACNFTAEETFIIVTTHGTHVR